MADRFRDTGLSTFDLIPAYYRDTDTERENAERLCLVLDDEFGRWDGQLDELRTVRDPVRTTDQQINFLFSEKGFEPPTMIDVDTRRRLLYLLPGFVRRKGDPRTVRDVVNLMIGLGVSATAFWSDNKYWFFGKKKFGLETRIGIFYRAPAIDHWVFGVSPFGIRTKITEGYLNQALAYTVQLRLPRPLTSEEQAAIDWAIRYFARAEDHYTVFFPPVSAYWIVATSKIGVDTKVRADCWKFGVSKFGKTSVICSPPTVVPSPIVLPTSPGTWVPFASDEGGIFYPSPPTPPMTPP